ncbi:hypothetical protein AJ88_20020 [Mesorhizobium amorphae CCBAU 01583]|nr:hypothetical protein AJ88_20020 [Mesorhizobium amorphae CCBAU 01583]
MDWPHVELIVPIAMEEKLRFAIREGGRTVGAGIVVTIKEQSSPALADRQGKGGPRGRPF